MNSRSSTDLQRGNQWVRQLDRGILVLKVELARLAQVRERFLDSFALARDLYLKPAGEV